MVHAIGPRQCAIETFLAKYRVRKSLHSMTIVFAGIALRMVRDAAELHAKEELLQEALEHRGAPQRRGPTGREIVVRLAPARIARIYFHSDGTLGEMNA
jgi:hypothetical protein